MTDDIHQIQGTSEGEMVKGDWHEFHVNIGRQYPVKLATKLPDVIAQAQAAGTSEAVWTYKEMEGADNPHRPGEKFKNRYLQTVEVGGTMTQPTRELAARPAAETHSIERQSTLRSVCSLNRTWKDDDEFFLFLERAGAWVNGTPPVPVVEKVEPGASTYADGSDIPFAPSIF